MGNLCSSEERQIDLSTSSFSFKDRFKSSDVFFSDDYRIKPTQKQPQSPIIANIPVYHKADKMNSPSSQARRVLASLPPFQHKRDPFSVGVEIIGPFRYPNGAMYRGEYEGSERQGMGKQVWEDGKVYEGSWMNDQQHGFGRIVFPDGDCYEGEISFDKYNGEGRYTRTCGICYSGYWLNNQRSGLGSQSSPNGFFYKGDFLRDMWHGFGEIRYPNGHKYVGQFEKNLKHGSDKTISIILILLGYFRSFRPEAMSSFFSLYFKF